MDILNNKKWGIIGGVFFTLFLLYFQLLRHDPMVDVDDFFLTHPITKISSVSDYIQARNESKVQDVQPIRDFTYWVDQQLQRATGKGFYHITNFIVWLGIAGTLYLILLQAGVSSGIALILFALFAFHPALNTTASWISGRKHLLSALFALIATLQFMKGITPRRAILIPLTYGLSCFSQTISICWPAWATLYWMLSQKSVGHLKKPTHSELVAFFLCGIVGLVCVWLNYEYYYVTYVAQNAGIGKFADSSWNTLFYKTLALGRYFFQILIPGWIIIPDHFPGNPQDYIGLFLLSAMSWGCWKTLGIKRSLTWLSLFFLFLLPVTFKMTNVYVSDTYILVPTAGIWILLGLFIDRVRTSFLAQAQIFQPTYVMASVGIVTLLFLSGSYQCIRSFESVFGMWEHAYTTEKTPANSARYALFLLDAGRVDESLEIGLSVEKWSPGMTLLPKLISKSIFLKKNITIEEKAKFLEARVPLSPWYSYYLAVLYASRGVFDRAEQLLRNEVDRRLPVLTNAMRDEIEMVAVGTRVFCSFAKKQDCPMLVQKIKASVNFHDWNEAEYQKRLSEFGMH